MGEFYLFLYIFHISLIFYRECVLLYLAGGKAVALHTHTFPQHISFKAENKFLNSAESTNKQKLA